ncbi:unnamed protein product [Lupinus luteus]|uniref:RING-type E3 ubiquitin transferase n=1 Tax=Lupinus luteus TaxID=3873 RepID=A0AAV1WTP4_LUPLU
MPLSFAIPFLINSDLSSYFGRCLVTPETIPFRDTDPDIFAASESIGPAAEYYRHFQDPSSDGFAEPVTLKILLQGSVLMAGRFNAHDQFRGWRLDIDNMTYEQLLDLSERIGFVNTGVKDDEIGCNIKNTKFQFSDDESKHQVDKKCPICQEEQIDPRKRDRSKQHQSLVQVA